ncbi:MAG: hypothetical protein ACTSO9_10100 [Candidatus Helarchaeota archaeon]
MEEIEEEFKKNMYNYAKSIYSKDKAEKIVKKGIYDVWFTIFEDLDNNEVYWLRYSILLPKSNLKLKPQQNIDDFLDSIPNSCSMLWFAYQNKSNPKESFIVKKIYPLSKAEGSKIEGPKNYTLIKIDESTISLDKMKGMFVLDSEPGKKSDFSWDLKFSDFSTPYSPIPLLGKILKLTSNFWYLYHPRIRISGKITIKGEEKEISNAIGTQTHTYG